MLEHNRFHDIKTREKLCNKNRKPIKKRNRLVKLKHGTRKLRRHNCGEERSFALSSRRHRKAQRMEKVL